MKLSSVVLSLSLALSLVACKDKKEGSEAPSKAEPATKSAEPSEPAAAAGTPVKTDAKALFTEFTTPDADGMALLDKYRPGVTVTGTIKNLGKEESGTPVVMLDAGEGNTMLGWKDDAAAAEKAKAWKVGDSITVTCQVGGAMDKLMQLTDCTP